MSEIPSEVRGGSDSNPTGPSSESSDDGPIDVCISHPNGAGRFKLHFRSSKPLVETLIAWTAEGRTDIWLTWGTTPLDARERVEHTLARAPVHYAPPPAASNEPPPTRASLLLGALGGVAGFACLIFHLTQKLNNVGEGLNKVTEEQQARDEQNRRMVARSLEGVQARTFRELEDADPAVRLQAVALVGQLYSADPRAIPALVKRVKDGDRKVRAAAAVVLGNTRTNSEEAAQALRGCLADEDEQVRKAAQNALAKLR